MGPIGLQIIVFLMTVFVALLQLAVGLGVFASSWLDLPLILERAAEWG